MADSLVWLMAGALAIGLGTAVVPWLNAEVLMLAVLPLARTPVAMAALVTAITMGQMGGKCLVYGAGRRSNRPRSSKRALAFDRWRARLQERPITAAAIVFVSALVGLPPFFLVALAAGAAGMALKRFAVVGTCGRLLHFGAVAWIPELMRRMT
jgi:membrane protein YqaA with SNARE-associated domain